MIILLIFVICSQTQSPELDNRTPTQKDQSGLDIRLNLRSIPILSKSPKICTIEDYNPTIWTPKYSATVQSVTNSHKNVDKQALFGSSIVTTVERKQNRSVSKISKCFNIFSIL